MKHLGFLGSAFALVFLAGCGGGGSQQTVALNSLAYPTGANSPVVTAVSDTGVVAGAVQILAGTSFIRNGVVWTTPSTPIVVTPPSSGSAGEGFTAISPDGQVLAGTDGVTAQVFEYSLGSAVVTAHPSITTGAVSSVVVDAVHDSGGVVARIGVSGASGTPLTWYQSNNTTASPVSFADPAVGTLNLPAGVTNPVTTCISENGVWGGGTVTVASGPAAPTGAAIWNLQTHQVIAVLPSIGSVKSITNDGTLAMVQPTAGDAQIWKSGPGLMSSVNYLQSLGLSSASAMAIQAISPNGTYIAGISAVSDPIAGSPPGPPIYWSLKVK